MKRVLQHSAGRVGVQMSFLTCVVILYNISTLIIIEVPIH